MKKIQAIRGMNDVLPAQSSQWQYVEDILRELLNSYAYQEIRFPVLEQTQLFKRSIGEVTDIVEKEMYTFEDRNGDSLSLRPEGTACCVRAAEQAGLLYNQTQKVWYMGPMYRHERPQKGRYRQFYQLGVEAFGLAGTDIESELIMLCADMWDRLGLTSELQLEINNLGSAENRAAYGAELKAWLESRKEQLDEDSKRRLDSNVLRILDSKVPSTQELLQDAPELSAFIDDESCFAFDSLLSLLEKAGINPVVKPSLVRGLDYYNGVVFEWTTQALGAQGTVCAGGRYDGLSRQLGGTDTPGIGFALGMERLILMLEAMDAFPGDINQRADVYIAVVGEGVKSQAQLLARGIRQKLPGLRVLTHCGGGKYNAQLKKAFASQARIALILEGEEEQSVIKLRELGEDHSESLQLEADIGILVSRISEYFNVTA